MGEARGFGDGERGCCALERTTDDEGAEAERLAALPRQALTSVFLSLLRASYCSFQYVASAERTWPGKWWFSSPSSSSKLLSDPLDMALLPSDAFLLRVS